MAFIQSVYNIAFASNTTTASLTPSLEIPGSFVYMYLVIPTMTVGYSNTNTKIYLQASADNVNFYRFTNQEGTTNTLVAGINDFMVASSVSQRLISLPNFAMRYLKIEVTGTVTNPTAQTAGFQVVCVANQ